MIMTDAKHDKDIFDSKSVKHDCPTFEGIFISYRNLLSIITSLHHFIVNCDGIFEN